MPSAQGRGALNRAAEQSRGERPAPETEPVSKVSAANTPLGPAEALTVDQMAEARTHAERMLRGWSPAALKWSQLGNAARIAMAFLQELAVREEWAREGIDENHAIFTLTGVPRQGFTLQQEIRAQHEELGAEVEALRDVLRVEQEVHFNRITYNPDGPDDVACACGCGWPCEYEQRLATALSETKG